MAAKQSALAQLHELLTASMIAELQWYREQDPFLPAPAATYAAVSKFLKDNNITCDPTDRDDLDALRKQFEDQLKSRRPASAVMANALELAQKDVDALLN